MKYKGLARDIVGLGSLPIYLFFLIISIFLDPKITIFLVIGLLFQGLLGAFVSFNKYITRYVILLFSSIIISNFNLFMFMSIILILMLFSFYYLKEKKRSLIKSTIISVLIGIVSYFIYDFLIKLIGW